MRGGARDVADMRAVIAETLLRHRHDGRIGWPIVVSVRLPRTQTELECHVGEVMDHERTLRAWVARNGCSVTETTRRIGGMTVPLVSAIRVPDEASALRIVDTATGRAYGRTRSRIRRLMTELGLDESVAGTVSRLTDDESDANFDCVVRAAAYFASHDTAGMRPRAVPVAGFGSKWLNQANANRRKAVLLASGRDDLGLEERPRELRMRHLDPALADEPDMVVVRPWAKPPRTDIRHVIIVENKDTYQEMPPIADGLCVWGQGAAISATLGLLPWLKEREGIRVVYWGDMDAEGFEILSRVREAGVDCESVLMDRAAYDDYADYGTNLMPDGKRGRKEIAVRAPKPTPGLRPAERKLYEALCAGEGVPYRRLEQERIPMAVAAAELRRRGLPVE